MSNDFLKELVCLHPSKINKDPYVFFLLYTKIEVSFILIGHPVHT